MSAPGTATKVAGLRSLRSSAALSTASLPLRRLRLPRCDEEGFEEGFEEDEEDEEEDAFEEVAGERVQRPSKREAS